MFFRSSEDGREGPPSVPPFAAGWEDGGPAANTHLPDSSRAGAEGRAPGTRHGAAQLAFTSVCPEFCRCPTTSSGLTGPFLSTAVEAPTDRRKVPSTTSSWETIACPRGREGVDPNAPERGPIPHPAPEECLRPGHTHPWAGGQPAPASSASQSL